MLLPATHLGADSTSPELGAHDSVCWWRWPGFGALRSGQLQPRLKEPYLVLDLGKFTARCRSCAWKSTPNSGLAEVRFAYSTHVCATGPIGRRMAAVDIPKAVIGRPGAGSTLGGRAGRPVLVQVERG
jgi:hypothetical protein